MTDSATMDLEDQEYLGDGLYVGTDGFHLWLYTSNGILVTNKVALEPQVLANFLDYINARYQREGSDE